MSKGTFTLSASTRLLSQRLMTLAEGETVEYAELSRIAGADVTGPNRHQLQSARRVAERERGVVTECVHRVGVRRVASSNLSSVGDCAISRTRRISRRAVKSMLSGIEATPPKGQALTATPARVSVLGAIAQAITTKRIETFEAAVAKEQKELPVQTTLEMFSKQQ